MAPRYSTDRPPPVDRGWAWVVLAAQFMQNMIGSAIYMTGLFNVAFLQEFQLNKSATALIGSLHAGLFCCTGPLSSVLIASVGARKTVFIGVVMTMAGYFIAAFSNSYLVICISYGAIAGIGIGCTYLPGVVMIGFYFNRYRNFAFGIVTMAVGIGQIWLAPLIDFLISYYGWRGTMIILSGIMAHFAIVGAVLRPIDFEPDHLYPDSTGTDESPLTPDWEEAQVILTTNVSHNGTIQNGNGLTGSKGALQHPISNGVNKTHLPQYLKPSISTDIKPDKFHSSASIYLESTGSITEPCKSGISQSSSNIHIYGHNWRNLSKRKPLSKLLATDSFLARMSSDYIGRSYSSINNIALAVPSEPHKILPEEEKTLFSRLKDTLMVLHDIRFALYCLSMVAITLGQSVVYLHLPAFAISMGTSPSRASTLLAIMGAANIISRFLSGLVTSSDRCSSIRIYNISLALNGAFLLLAPVMGQTFMGQIAVAASFSLLGNCYCAIMTPLAIDIVGLAGISVASGMILFAGGIGFLCGPPIAGLLFDISGAYTTTFYFAGSCIIVGVMIMLPVPYLSSKKDPKETCAIA